MVKIGVFTIQCKSDQLVCVICCGVVANGLVFVVVAAVLAVIIVVGLGRV